ncbi:MAG: TrkA family potassium uptake protein [Bacillota bacterium]|nr:TrkA family potassium uptake protein [Bacillota bacterium]
MEVLNLKKSFLVIGAGRFGKSVARTLCDAGHDVMVVDKDETLVQQISSDVTDAVSADITSESCVKALGVRDFDAIVLAIGFDVQASIMAAILLIEKEARYIVAKAQTDLHGKVLEKIGINRVIYPERDMGQKIARSLIAPTIIDMIELSDDYSVVEVKAPAEMVGKTLLELNLRARYGVSVIAFRRNNGGSTNISPVAEDVVEAGDIIVAIGENKQLEKLDWV